jgi:DNA-binding CsgD family transcriptional regulator
VTAMTLGERSLAIAVEHQLNREAALAYRRLANIREYSSHYTAERDAHLQAISLCRQQNDAGFEVSCMVCLSYVFFRTGEWKRAQETIKDITRRPDSHPGCRAGAVGVQAMIAAFRGEQRQTLALLQEAGAGLRRYGVLLLEFHLLWAQAYMLEAAGDRHGAGAAYLRMLDHWDRTEDRHDVLPGAVSAAAFFGDEGEWRQLARIRDIMHTVVNANDNEESRAARLAVLGESAAEKQDWSLASSHLAGSLEGYDRLGVPVERALMRGRLARMLTAAGREREAAEAREAGAAIARPLGMRSVLVALDAPVAGSTPRQNEVLTARQHDVLRLLASGLTNKEAADRLSLSPRTVEMHVAALLDRLNCRTRTEAMHRAGELGLLD